MFIFQVQQSQYTYIHIMLHIEIVYELTRQALHDGHSHIRFESHLRNLLKLMLSFGTSVGGSKLTVRFAAMCSAVRPSSISHIHQLFSLTVIHNRL